jgi:hypothetical protein
MGSLGLLLGAGAAWGQQPSDQPSEMTGQQAINQMAGKPDCRDAGVTVAFTTGSAELDQNAKGALDGVATWLKANPDRRMRLQGFADTTGDTEANLVLSEKRANAVKDYLVSQGVDATRVTTIGRGEHTDHLPANGRAVTFLACQPAGATAQGEAMPPPPEAGAPPPPAYPPPGEEPIAEVPNPMPPPAAVPPAPWMSRFGWALMAGGGFQDFTNSTTRSLTNGGGAWDARFVGGTNSIIGFEAAYIGAARGIANLGVIPGNNPNLVANGVEGTLRLNAPIRFGNQLVEPYAFGGVGYSRYHVTNFNTNTGVLTDFTANDNVMDVPAGGGVAYAYKAFIADVRAGYTSTFFNSLLVNQPSGDGGALNNWGIGGQVGARF